MRGAFLSVLLLSCSHPPCAPSNCTGCCDEAGICATGTADSACGAGAACVDCSALCGSASCACEQSQCVLHTEPKPYDAGTPSTPRFVDDTGISAAQLGVLVNDADPQSRLVAGYYLRARGLPAENLFHVTLPVEMTVDVSTFNTMRDALEPQLLARDIQALAVTWSKPYYVNCMSMTSALALGFDSTWCQPVCMETKPAPVFDGHHPTDVGVRPAMMLAATNVGNALELIDRGVASDHTFPAGTGYLVRTRDDVRNIRWPDFKALAQAWPSSALTLTYLDAEGIPPDPVYLSGANDVLFYFTGVPKVGALDTDTFLPGAIADHLTSYGGQLFTSTQMSSLRWLEAGATASFGTIREPCTYTEKFPQASVVVDHYYRGEPVVEAYWRSVAEPGEGLFIGEPLARPFGLKASVYDADAGTLTLETTALRPGVGYQIEAADSLDGPWAPTGADAGPIAIVGLTTVTVTPVVHAFYRLR